MDKAALRERIAKMPFEATLVHKSRKPSEPDRWFCVLDGFETTYQKGTGLRKLTKRVWGGVKATLHPKTVYELGEWQVWTKPVDPTRDELLQSLALDAQCYENTPDLDSFATEYGYSDKVSTAIATFEGCRKASAFFRSRGLDPFSEVFSDEEPEDESEPLAVHCPAHTCLPSEPCVHPRPAHELLPGDGFGEEMAQ